MISRRGTRTSGASSGVTQILREAGSGPVVTAGSVVSGLERMFMVYPPLNLFVIPDGPSVWALTDPESKFGEVRSGATVQYRIAFFVIASLRCF